MTLSHRNLVANASQCAAWVKGEVENPVGLSVLPFFHSYGLISNLLCGTAVAATQILLHRFIPRVVAQLLEQHQPTTFNAVPAMLASLNEIFRTKPLKTRSLQFVQVGGGSAGSGDCRGIRETHRCPSRRRLWAQRVQPVRDCRPARWDGSSRHDRTAAAGHRREDRRCRNW